MIKNVYISLFVFLGILVQQLIHAVIEIIYIRLLVQDYEKFGLHLSWNWWLFIHNFSSVLLLLGGILIGYQQGRKWWKIIYGNRK